MSRKPVKASFVLRFLAAIFAGTGLGLLVLAVLETMGGTPTNASTVPGLLIIGGIPLLLGLIGPVRILLTGAQVPEEVRHTLQVLAICLPLGGISLLASGWFPTPLSIPVSFGISGICAFAVAYAGFYSLAKTLPDTFYIQEMLAIMKSAGLFGKKEDSAANREIMLWCKGVRSGVPPGQPAPDGAVISLDGKSASLADYFQGDKPFSPLLLNLGSYTCPHHRKRIGELHGLMDRWEDRGVRFLTIYTAEAHPVDGWELPGQYQQDEEYTGNPDDFCFYHAKSLKDRRTMAQWLIEKKKFRLPVVLDSMENTLLTAYNSWPIRLYIIDKGTVVYTGKQGPFGYDPGEAEAALERLSAEQGGS